MRLRAIVLLHSQKQREGGRKSQRICKLYDKRAAGTIRGNGQDRGWMMRTIYMMSIVQVMWRGGVKAIRHIERQVSFHCQAWMLGFRIRHGLPGNRGGFSFVGYIRNARVRVAWGVPRMDAYARNHRVVSYTQSPTLSATSSAKYFDFVCTKACI